MSPGACAIVGVGRTSLRTDRVSRVLGKIELDESGGMMCDLLGLDPERVAIGQSVEASFEERPGQGIMSRFRVVEAADGYARNLAGDD